MEFDRKGLFEILAAVLFAVALFGTIIWYAAVGPFPWMPESRYWVLSAFTAVLFWVSIQPYRRYWGRYQFWLKTAGLLVGHCLAWAVVLRAMPEWRVLWFVPPAIVEAGVVVVLLHKLGFSPADGA